MESYIEHANISVGDTDLIIEFIKTACPDFNIRKRWLSSGYEWTHIGTDTSYIAMMCPDDLSIESFEPYVHNSSAIGFNHICIVVPNVQNVQKRLLDGGYDRGFYKGEIIDAKVRKSVYFRDPDGREWEFMEYLTENLTERNSYEA